MHDRCVIDACSMNALYTQFDCVKHSMTSAWSMLEGCNNLQQFISVFIYQSICFSQKECTDHIKQVQYFFQTTHTISQTEF